MNLKHNLTPLLTKHFGYSEFRENQHEIINSILQNENTLVIMPTGGGKSLCYQLSAIASEGTAIIISPLIALMKNQVDVLKGLFNIDGVANVLNSSLTKSDVELVKDQIKNGITKLLYMAPESLTKQKNIDFLKDQKISFVAIDEAHCISEWGHDFRPDYRKINSAVQEINTKLKIIALTATATPKVQDDIIKNLNLNKPNIFKSSFNRPNLFYEVKHKTENVDKDIVSFIKKNEGKSGIVYCLSRKKVDEFTSLLQLNNINALPYHAGLENNIRSSNQEHFLMHRCDVIVATIAFGMGIDKPDIRYVVHYDIPKSLEAYYQETGRAGRDDGTGHLLTFYSYKDIEKLEKFLSGKPVNEREIGRQLIMETISFAETSMCRRKYLLHYFGENFDSEDCNKMCDNCKNPKPTFEGKEYIIKLLNAIRISNETFKSKEIAKIMIGETNSLINQQLAEIQDVFGSGKDKKIEFWHSIIRQIYVKGLITKEIESYGVIKLTELGENFIQNPSRFTITEDHHYEINNSNENTVKGTAMDEKLFKMLTVLRKEISKKTQLPPAIIFQESSIIDMANNYPTGMKEMSQIQGVGIGKAEKYGKDFIELISKYVEENNIDRPSEMIIKTVPNKSSNKVYIIQSLDKKIMIEDIAKAKGLSNADLITEMETIVDSGTKLNIKYLLDNMMEEHEQEELSDFFKDSQNFSLEEARIEYAEEEFSDTEIRIARIHFITTIGN